MRRCLAVVAIASITISLNVQGQTLPGAPVRPSIPTTGYPRPARPGGVIIGTVVDAASGTPVPRAVVRLSGRGLDQTRVADDKGRFYFVDVPEAELDLVAAKTGFFDGAYGKQRAGGTAVPLSMSSNRWISDVRIALFKSAAISGIVSDEVNEPVPAVRVRAWRRQFVEGREQLVPAGEAVTNDDGTYRIFDLAPGTYVMSVPTVQVTLPIESIEREFASGTPTSVLWALLNLNAATSSQDRLVLPDAKHVLAVGRTAAPPPPNRGETLAYRTEFYPAQEVPFQAIPVTVGPSEDRAGVHFQLRLVPTHSVSGVVVGPNGPVPNQLVRLLPDGVDDLGFGHEAALTVTGPDGSFTMANVPAGHYRLQARGLSSVAGASTPAPADTTGPVTVASSKTWGQVDVFVGSNNLDGVIVAVRPPATLRGRIVLESTAARNGRADPTHVSISLLPETRTIGAALTQRAARDGTFEFPDLAAESYFVRVGSVPPGWSLKSVSSAGQDAIDRPVDLETDADVTITLTDRVTQIWGTARDQRGAPAIGATIVVLPPPGSGPLAFNPNRLREARASTFGIFRINGLPAGDYFVAAIDDAQAESWQDPARADALRAQATRVSIREGEQKMVDLRITRR